MGAWLDAAHRLDRRRLGWVLGVAGLVAVATMVWAPWRTPGQPAELSLPRVSTSDVSSGAGGVGTPNREPAGGVTPSADVVVHVAGAVVAPGVHRLPAGARWNDALAAAGGTRPDADLDRVNLAEPLVDGTRVYVPAIGELVPPAVAAAPEAGVGTPSGADGTGADGTGERVDVNAASAAELEALPGVGPATATAIVQHRSEHGPFRSVDDLLEVRGIGPAKLEALRDIAVVGPGDGGVTAGGSGAAGR